MSADYFPSLNIAHDGQVAIRDRGPHAEASAGPHRFQLNHDPDKQGFYGRHANHKVYYEVMNYTKMLSDVTKRNRIFFHKLNLIVNR
jgi:hypothetical protein